MKFVHLALFALFALVAARPQESEPVDPAIEEEILSNINAQLEAQNSQDSQEIGAQALFCSGDGQCDEGKICEGISPFKICVNGCRPSRKCLPGKWCLSVGNVGICKPGCKSPDNCSPYQTCANMQTFPIIGQVGSCKYECNEHNDCTGGKYCDLEGGHKCKLACDLTKPCELGQYCLIPGNAPNQCKEGCLNQDNCPTTAACVKAPGASATTPGVCTPHQCVSDNDCTATKYCDINSLVRTCKTGCRNTPNNCLEFAGGVCGANRVCSYPSCSPAYDRCANGFYCHPTAKKCKAGCKAKNSLCKTADNKNGKCNAQHVCVAIVKKKGDACKTTIANDCGTGLKCIATRKGYSKGVCHPVVGAGKTCNRGQLYAVCSTGLKCKYNKCKA